MKEFKFGISDANNGKLEGSILGTPTISSGDSGKVAINMVVSSARFTSSGKKYFQYDVVVFSPLADRLISDVTIDALDGCRVSCEYHLMSVDHYCRPVIDYIQIDE